MEWVSSHILIVSALVLAAAGIFILMPKRTPLPRALGGLLTLAGGIAFAIALTPKTFSLADDLLFYVFSIMALGSAVLMITSHNPVYGALWFALATLAVCGLFLLQSAPFLAAATIIVYAGAIIVTFLFVIMLAQQSGLSVYDQRTHQPLLATIGAFILLAALLVTIDKANIDVVTAPATTDLAVTNPFSKPIPEAPIDSMHGLGRSLFGDYLFAVEMAGALLLVASIGAIIIAPRKERGTF